MSALARLCVSLGVAVTALSACYTAPGFGIRSQTLLRGETLADLAQQSLSATPEVRSRPVIGIALGGGGLRGYAHIGVLQALEERGLKPDIVVGTSIGAIIGSAYASGQTPDQLWQSSLETNVFDMVDWTLNGNGFIKGDALARWVNATVGGRKLEQLPKPFGAVATDLAKSSSVLLRHGDVGQAVRASAAIPGVFLRVPYHGGDLVDGGVTSLVPVRFAKALGADIVIAVDIYCAGPRYQGTGYVSTVLEVSQAQSCLLAESDKREADLVIAPAVVPGAANDSKARDAARVAGFQGAIAALQGPAGAVLISRTTVFAK